MSRRKLRIGCSIWRERRSFTRSNVKSDWQKWNKKYKTRSVKLSASNSSVLRLKNGRNRSRSENANRTKNWGQKTWKTSYLQGRKYRDQTWKTSNKFRSTRSGKITLENCPISLPVWSAGSDLCEECDKWSIKNYQSWVCFCECVRVWYLACRIQWTWLRCIIKFTASFCPRSWVFTVGQAPKRWSLAQSVWAEWFKWLYWHNLIFKGHAWCVCTWAWLHSWVPAYQQEYFGPFLQQQFSHQTEMLDLLFVNLCAFVVTRQLVGCRLLRWLLRGAVAIDEWVHFFLFILICTSKFSCLVMN